ncbi:prephenate/arogenate dehydrogenase [Prochlorococcus marinus]|uniref:Prephenate dehydrogenase n=1 Tax=Prochlorococcus marinus (strain MIT 9211) TaxID=93059 RepID=A9BCQ3_PROM4|nr:prephenate/arogenate dehydrogenase [Prochlorococcus marinus]ABX09615.1 Prephenate dehydrogenase [Prochlorococcus marinus str. MIT 9211]
MESESARLNQIGIVGLGLIGGSLGLDLQSLGYKVCGLVNRHETLERAKERGLAQLIDTDPEILSNCSMVILALPLSQIITPSQALISCLNPNSVVTDVGSVKTPVLNSWEKLHPRFVASHPMAGTSEAGVEAGQKGLFKDRPWIATPTEKTDLEALEEVRKVAVSLGSKWITADANRHDQAVALISHLPLLISATLLTTAGEGKKDKSDIELAKLLSSSGFTDTTRVGGGNPKLGVDITSHNSRQILDVLNSYQSSLKKLEGIIRLEQWEKLQEKLENAKAIRRDFLD